MNLKLNQQLWLLCGGFLAILLGITVLSHLNSNRLMAQFDNVADVQLPAVRNMTLADMMHDGLRSVVLAAVVAAESNDSEGLQESISEAKEKSDDFRAYLGELKTLKLNESTLRAIVETEPEMNEYIRHTEHIVKLAKEQGYAAAKNELPLFNKSFRNLEIKMEKLGDLIKQDADTAHESGAGLRLLNLAIAAVGALFCLAGGFLITTSLVRKITGFAERLQSIEGYLDQTSGSLNGASQRLASGSTESAASLEETVASLEELSSMVKMNSENAQKGSELAAESFTASKQGVEAIQGLISNIDVLQRSSARMEEVINVIDDIAFQTNLLALNASVEAARAGEMGKGFAVVADAVRSLAQRSADSAKDIAKMIQESISSIRDSSQSAEKSSEFVGKILSSAQKVLDITKEISDASAEQFQGISQISSAMNNLDQASQANAQVAQNVAQSSDQMAHLSGNLKEVVGELNFLIKGEN